MKSFLKAGCLISATACIAFSASLLPAADKSPAGHLQNIARGKPYTLSVKPSYPLCTDPGDATDLTDGALSGVWTPGGTAGYWTEKGTVGWQHARKPVNITVDLGKVEPIRGAAFRTIGGGAGVTWPHSVAMLVSADGTNFYFAGELTRLCKDKLPPAYPHGKPHWFWTDKLETKGRYVSFIAVPSGIFLFTDELEIYRGDEALLKTSYSATPMTEDALIEQGRLTRLGAYRRMKRDVETALSRVDTSAMDARQKGALKKRLAELSEEVDRSEFPEDWQSFKAVVPFNDLHREIFKVYADCLSVRNTQAPSFRQLLTDWYNAATGVQSVSFWQSPPYVILPLFAAPDNNLSAITVKMMRNERRPAVFNVTNASRRAAKVRFNITGLPGGMNPASVHVYQVDYVDTREGEAVASALVRLITQAGYYASEAPAGMTRQIWLQVDSKDLLPGTHRGQLEIQCGKSRESVALIVDVAECRMPDRMDCSLGMCDYVHNKAYEITEKNQPTAIADINDHVMDMVWATPGSLPSINPKDFDATNNLTGKLDFAQWDAFVKTWPGMKYYLVFAAFHDTTPFAGKTPGTPEFDKAVSQWAVAWAKHNREKLGLKPKQACILWIDEPGSASDMHATYYYSKATKQGTDDITVFNDPAASVVNMNYGKEAIEQSDIVMPTRGHFLMLSQKDRDYYRTLPARNIQLWFYMCSGPAHMFNTAYHRLQPWYCFEHGAVGSLFWSYGDAGKGDNWNEYWAVGGCSYTPLYIGPDSITNSKHWEAVRAGILDYQYLKILKDRVAELKKSGAQNSNLAEAEQVSQTIAASVISKTHEKFKGDEEGAPLNEDVVGFAEEARLKVLDMLKKLQDK